MENATTSSIIFENPADENVDYRLFVDTKGNFRIRARFDHKENINGLKVGPHGNTTVNQKLTVQGTCSLKNVRDVGTGLPAGYYGLAMDASTGEVVCFVPES